MLRRTSVYAFGGIFESRGPGASGARNVDTLFFLLGWDRYGFHIQHVGTPYAELVFLHPMVSVGHVGHSNASGAPNVDALFFMLDWD
jgi:hypothetical protein